MRALILYHQYDGTGALVKTELKEFKGGLSALIQACAKQKTANGIYAPHQITFLDDDNLRDPIEKKKSDHDDIFLRT